MKFRYNTSFSFLNIPRDLDPSYKMDLDFCDCFERKKTKKKLCLMNEKNIVCSVMSFWRESFENLAVDLCH